MLLSTMRRMNNCEGMLLSLCPFARHQRRAAVAWLAPSCRASSLYDQFCSKRNSSSVMNLKVS